VSDAHHVGLLVTPYTFRNENSFLPADYQKGTNPADYGDAIAEDIRFYEAGVDGFFTTTPTPPCWPASSGSTRAARRRPPDRGFVAVLAARHLIDAWAAKTG